MASNLLRPRGNTFSYMADYRRVDMVAGIQKSKSSAIDFFLVRGITLDDFGWQDHVHTTNINRNRCPVLQWAAEQSTQGKVRPFIP